MARGKQKRKLTSRQYLTAIAGVAKTTYKAAPLAVVVQIIGAIITAVLPIVTTYFAALTTTALAEAYAGNPNAGERAIEFVIITAFLGIVMTAWGSIENYISQLMRYRVEAGMSDQMYEHFLARSASGNIATALTAPRSLPDFSHMFSIALQV